VVFQVDGLLQAGIELSGDAVVLMRLAGARDPDDDIAIVTAE
jgi:hypothetical protein